MDNTTPAKDPTLQKDWKTVNKRSIASCIILSILTCGIYMIYWQYLLVKNVKALNQDESGCVGEMLCLILVPFYPLYWWYTRGKTVEDRYAEYDYRVTGKGIVYLILGIFGFEIVSMAIMQNDFNTLPSSAPKKKIDVRKLTTLALLSALIIVLQSLSAFGVLKVGVFSITLTLVPIVVGGILLGPGAGAILGGVFGVMVCIFSLTGVDVGGLMVFQTNLFVATLMCMLKGIAAGLIPALVYKILPKKFPVLNAFIASILAPIANTGIFIAGMLLFFRPLLEAWKHGSAQAADSMWLYLILGICGINFVIEFTVNAILSPAIATIVKAVQKDKHLR